MSIDYSAVIDLLKVEEATRGHPNLKAIHDLSLIELTDISGDAQEELDEIAKEAKDEEDKAAADKAAAEAKDKEVDEDEEEDE